MAENRHWFWREIVVGVGVSTGLYARLNINPTAILLETLGTVPDNVRLGIGIIGFLPVMVAIFDSYEYGHVFGVGSFLSGIFSGYILTAVPAVGMMILLFAAVLAGGAQSLKDEFDLGPW